MDAKKTWGAHSDLEEAFVVYVLYRVQAPWHEHEGDPNQCWPMTPGLSKPGGCPSQWKTTQPKSIQTPFYSTQMLLYHPVIGAFSAKIKSFNTLGAPGFFKHISEAIALQNTQPPGRLNDIWMRQPQRRHGWKPSNTSTSLRLDPYGSPVPLVNCLK